MSRFFIPTQSSSVVVEQQARFSVLGMTMLRSGMWKEITKAQADKLREKMITLTDGNGKQFHILRFDLIKKGDVFIMVEGEDVVIKVAEEDFGDDFASFILKPFGSVAQPG